MKTKLLRQTRQNYRIIEEKDVYILQYKEAGRWEIWYDGTLSECLRLMHRQMRRFLKTAGPDKRERKVIC